MLAFNDPWKEPFEDIVRKGENAGNQHFLHFPQCFQRKTAQVEPYQNCLL